MSFTSIEKKGAPLFNSIQLEMRITDNPKMARYLGTLLFFIKAPPNIITTPQIAVNIIVFIFLFRLTAKN